MNGVHDDIRRLEQWLDEAERDARALAADCDEASGTWRADARSWSVAECLDHLATGNRIYLGAMAGPAERALRSGRTRRRRATPGLVGGWFVRALEPPVPAARRMRAPGKIRPRTRPSMQDALEVPTALRIELHHAAGRVADDVLGARRREALVRAAEERRVAAERIGRRRFRGPLP